MAFRSSSIDGNSGGGTFGTAPPGVVADDYLAALWVYDGPGESPTPPSGWTLRYDFGQASPDGHSAKVYDKIATGSDAFGFVTAGVSGCVVIIGAWSGRDTAAPRSAAQTTSDTASNTSPIAASYGGVTAAQDDDIAVFWATDQTANDGRWTSSTISGYSEQRDGFNLDWVSGVGLQTRDAVSAGATGALAATLTRDSGSGDAGYGALVLAIKAAGEPPVVPRIVTPVSSIVLTR